MAAQSAQNGNIGYTFDLSSKYGEAQLVQDRAAAARARTRVERLLGVGAVAAVLAVSACTAAPATNPSTATGELTLVETKSPVQLLRNEALGRVDAQFVADVRNTTDASAACSNADDPEGLIRQWQSGADIVLAGDAHPDYVTERLVQSFTGDGWDDEVDAESSPAITRLSSTHSVASIEISSVEGAGVIHISVSGPCVTTAGPSSEEVTSLG